MGRSVTTRSLDLGTQGFGAMRLRDIDADEVDQDPVRVIVTPSSTPASR